MNNERLALLVKKAIAQNITESERNELFLLIANPKNKSQVDSLLENAWIEFNELPDLEHSEKEKMILDRILKPGKIVSIDRGHSGARFRWAKYAAAAILLLASSIICLRYFKHAERNTNTEVIAGHEIKIAPGGNKAQLILSNGKTITLDSVSKGVIVKQNGLTIKNTTKGALEYLTTSTNSSDLQWNEIKVPKGGEYKITLSDGTIVHMNAESMLRFPVRFTRNERTVELTGEAFFVVAHDRTKPFFVKTTTQVTRVYGTRFNINAYNSDHVTTTLEEGSIMVSSASKNSIMLKPGESSLNDSKSSRISLVKLDVDEVLAWEKGRFIFNNENIHAIMDRISRWYDIEPVYEGNLNNKNFGGVFSRSRGIQTLLENFKATGLIDYKIEGRRIIIIGK